MSNEIWKGRFDGEDGLQQRIFQKVEVKESETTFVKGDFVLHGFACDEGVRRNKGRTGAKDAPDTIRKNLSNFPVTSPLFRLVDCGNIVCDGPYLEEAQTDLAQKTAQLLRLGAKSVVLGGGHEVMYAHFRGLRTAFPDKKIGIINIDAHFDNRIPQEDTGASSGTGFWQIAQEEPINSLHIGIQRNSNTLQLFDIAHQYGMKYILADELFFENLPSVYERIDAIAEQVDVLYLTVCMDVFNASVAPGVSAAAYNGIFPDAAFMHFFRRILSKENLVALDVAEVNPEFDIAERTARLAASLVNEWFMS